jgi:hypothetical protein
VYQTSADPTANDVRLEFRQRCIARPSQSSEAVGDGPEIFLSVSAPRPSHR